mmetsp:Transcript_27766/g.51833  ORF Transcript_27766/g.51833 Transcript_27766/m.51833 type:complete len:91 (-) Transcript_27766:573-845(-)
MLPVMSWDFVSESLNETLLDKHSSFTATCGPALGRCRFKGWTERLCAFVHSCKLFHSLVAGGSATFVIQTAKSHESYRFVPDAFYLWEGS